MFLPRTLAGEEHIGLSNQGTSVVGAFRVALLRARAHQELDQLSQLPHCGRLALTCGRRLLGLFGLGQRARQPLLLKFLTLVCCEYLPTERRLWMKNRNTNNRNRGETCKLCGADSETNTHSLLECCAPEVVNTRHGMVMDAVNFVGGEDHPRDAVAIPWSCAGHPTKKVAGMSSTLVQCKPGKHNFR